MIASMFWIIAGIVYVLYKVFKETDLNNAAWVLRGFFGILGPIWFWFPLLYAVSKLNTNPVVGTIMIFLFVVTTIGHYVAIFNIDKIKEAKKQKDLDACSDEKIVEFCNQLKERYGMQYWVTRVGKRLGLCELSEITLKLPRLLYNSESCRFLTLPEAYTKMNKEIKETLSFASNEELCDSLGIRAQDMPGLIGTHDGDMREVLISYIMSRLGYFNSHASYKSYFECKEKFKTLLAKKAELKKRFEDAGYHLSNRVIWEIALSSNSPLNKKYSGTPLYDLYEWACLTYYYRLEHLDTKEKVDVAESLLGKRIIDIKPAGGILYDLKIRELYIIDYIMSQDGLRILPWHINDMIPESERQRYRDYAEVFKKEIERPENEPVDEEKQRIREYEETFQRVVVGAENKPAVEPERF